MGSNDHNPTGSATLQPWKNRGPKEVLFWGNVKPDLVVAVVSKASVVNAYVGFGQSSDQSALLFYFRRENLNERIPLENYKSANDFLEWTLDNWLRERK